MSHNEMIGEIKTLSERISLTSAAKAFLYSLSSGDMRYRSALSSLVWARSLPVHDPVPDSKEKTDYHTPACMICGWRYIKRTEAGTAACRRWSCRKWASADSK
jgi:hypothetical protein